MRGAHYRKCLRRQTRGHGITIDFCGMDLVKALAMSYVVILNENDRGNQEEELEH